MIAAKTLSELPVAAFAFALIVVHIAALGFCAVRWLGVRPVNLWCALTLRGAVGLALLGLEMFALGYVHGWNRPVLCGSGVVMLVGLYAARRSLPGFVVALRAELRSLFLENRLLFTLCIITLIAVALGSLVPPTRTDEIEYHWPASVFWAQAGGWVFSPYRLMNGAALMHLIYTVSAVFSSPVAAHWTSALCLILLACGCAGLAKACLGRPLAALAGVLSCPVLAVEASVAYTDTAGAMFCVSAYVALLCGGANLGVISPWAALLCGLLFAATFSVKSFLLAALPAAVAFVLWRTRRNAPEAQRLSLSIRRVSAILLPILVTVGVWMTHTYALSGKLTDSRHVYFLHHRIDPLHRPTGGEVGRVPDLRDLITLPFIPVFSSVLGQKEPWGGRTGLLIVPFVPFGIFALRRLPTEPRLRAGWVLAGAASSFFLLGLITEKTRYHAFVWPMLLVIAAVGYRSLQENANPRVVRVSAAAFLFLAALGMTDALHVVLRGIRALP